MNKYYNLKNILKENALYNVIIGERSNGKTYATLEYAVKEYFKTGGQIAIIRRWKEDITRKRSSELFTSIIQNNLIYKYSKGKYTSIIFNVGKFYFCNYDENNKPIYDLESDCLGHIFALSDMEHNKSISYPNVTTIIFDEFLTKYVYLNDEFMLFMNTLSTIIRDRNNVKIFMLGNTVNKFCPYFDEMGLNHIKDMKQGSIDLYTYGDTNLKVAVEYCNNLNRKKESNTYFAFNNPKLKMITSGSWELDIYPHLPCKYKPKDILLTYFIIFNNDIFQCEIIKADNTYFTYIHEKTTPLQVKKQNIVYTLEQNNNMLYSRNILKPINKVQNKIKWFYDADKVFYQNNDVGNTINNYLKLCRG